MILEKIIEMPEEMAMDILVKAIDYHSSKSSYSNQTYAMLISHSRPQLP